MWRKLAFVNVGLLEVGLCASQRSILDFKFAAIAVVPILTVADSRRPIAVR